MPQVKLNTADEHQYLAEELLKALGEYNASDPAATFSTHQLTIATMALAHATLATRPGPYMKGTRPDIVTHDEEFVEDDRP